MMMDRRFPLVTIAIPTYNRANKYLREAIECSVNQTYKNIEVIISDNCSTDNTEEVVKSFNDPRVRYIKQNVNVGMLNNENICVENAKGDFFMLLCDDDMIDYDLVEVCMRAANYDTNVGVILTGARSINSDRIVLQECKNNAGGLSTVDFFLAWFDHKVPLYLCSTLYNTKRLKELGGFRSKKALYEDDVALVQIAAKYGRVDVRDVKASFRIHGENIGSTAKISDWCEDGIYLLDVMCNVVDCFKDIIRNRGMLFFCREIYRLCDRIKSPMNRFYAYLTVYKKFNYCQSPLLHICSKRLFSMRAYWLCRGIKNKIITTAVRN